MNIFVSSQIPEGKLAQLLAYGARVFRVAGSYAQAYDLCTQACEEYGWYNRSAAVNPYLVEGKKTGGLELAEQCANDPPDWVACSVGDGCSIAGVHKGLVQMCELGLIDWSAKMLGVQAAGVAPIMQAFESGKLDRNDTGKTYADSINVGDSAKLAKSCISRPGKRRSVCGGDGRSDSRGGCDDGATFGRVCRASCCGGGGGREGGPAAGRD